MMRNNILPNIFWLLTDKLIRILGTLFVGIWIARYLGPTDYGMLNYAFAYTALFSVFVRLGLDQIIVRELVKKVRLAPYLLGTAFVLKIVGSIIATLCVFLSLCFSDISYLAKLVILIIASGFIFQSFDVIDYFYQSKVLSKYVVIARNSAFLISSSMNIYFIVYEYDVIYFAIANVVHLFLSSLFLVYMFKKSGNEIKKWRFSTKLSIRLLKDCWPLAISVLLVTIHMRIDQIMIGNLLDLEQVGIYSVAVKLAEFWIFIPGIIISTLTPYFVNLREEDGTLYQDRLMQLYSLMFWMGGAVGLVTIIYGKEIIGMLFGNVYIDAYAALVFNIWSGIFMSLAMARGIWMINENLQQYRLYNNVIAVSINITANLLLIPKLGIAGAALATLITQATGMWVISFVWQPLRGSTWATMKAVNPIYLLRFRRGG